MADNSITVDLSSLTIGDLTTFEGMSSGNVRVPELVAFLDRVVVGGASHLPLPRLKEIMAAINTAMKQLSDPTDGQGKA